MENAPKTVQAYRMQDGTCPFRQWYRSLASKDTRLIISERVDRLALGNPGDCKPVGNGIHELRIHHGPGYRVYFSYEEQTVVLLLVGGDKSTQKQDIKTAQTYLKDYEQRKGDAS